MRVLVVLLLLAAVSAWRLDLSLQSLEQPPEDLCQRNVTEVILGANKLTDAPQCCPRFRSLQVHRNLIEQLPEGWLRPCPRLEEVSVSGNKLPRLPAGLLSAASFLRRLQASRNLLDALPQHLLRNATSLRELDLSRNQLTELPPAFLETNTQLEELFLQGNLLASLPEQLLAACGRLRQLWLSENRLSRLPAALLSAAPRLRALRLDRNHITTVDAAAFHNNQQLRLIDLSNNYLTSLPPGLFSNAESLRYLLLGGNQLREVPAADILPGRRISLDLSHNHLQTVEDFGVFDSSRVWLDGNRWRCACSLEPVRRVAKSARSVLWFQQPQLCFQDRGGRQIISELDLSHCHVSSTYRVGSATVYGAVLGAVSTSSDLGTTASEFGSSEVSASVPYVSETATSTIGSDENDGLSSLYDENTTIRIASPETPGSPSPAPSEPSEEPYEFINPDDEVELGSQSLGLIAHNATKYGSYISATTDIVVASPIAPTPEVNTTQTGNAGTNVNESGSPQTNTDTVYNDDSDSMSIEDS